MALEKSRAGVHFLRKRIGLLAVEGLPCAKVQFCYQGVIRPKQRLHFRFFLKARYLYKVLARQSFLIWVFQKGILGPSLCLLVGCEKRSGIRDPWESLSNGQSRLSYKANALSPVSQAS